MCDQGPSAPKWTCKAKIVQLPLESQKTLVRASIVSSVKRERKSIYLVDSICSKLSTLHARGRSVVIACSCDYWA